MKSGAFVVLLAAALSEFVAASIVSPPDGAPARAQVIPGVYILELEGGHDLDSVVQDLPGCRRRKLFAVLNGGSVQCDDSEAAGDIASRLGGHAAVKAVWPVRTGRADFGRFDVHPQIQKRNVQAAENHSAALTSHVMSQVDKMHARGFTGKGIKMGVIDTGIDYTHEALGGCFGEGCLVARGGNFADDADDTKNDTFPYGDPMDDEGHGTHIAGIIAAQRGKTHWPVAGAAPGVSLGAYKVMNRKFDVSDDSIVAALNRALEDGNDMICMSLAQDIGSWQYGPLAVAISRIVDKGVPVIVAAGNEGWLGPFSVQAVTSARGVASVAQFSNFDISTLLYNFTYTVGDCEEHAATFAAKYPELWSNSSLALWTDVANTTNDGCEPLPEDTPDLSDKIVLFDQGRNCSMWTRQVNAEKKNARRFLFYDGARGRIEAISGTDVVIAMVAPETAAEWMKQLKDGKSVIISIGDLLKSKPYLVRQPNKQTGGALRHTTTWGPTLDMAIKPQFGTVGHSILSTYPVRSGSYAVSSGTSQAGPLAAAIYALLAEAKGGAITPAEFESLLSSTAEPQLAHSGGSDMEFLPVLAPVAQQGGGLLKAENAFLAKTFVNMSSFPFNDTDHFIETVSFTIKNSDQDTDVTYKLSNVQAATVYVLQNDSMQSQPLRDEIVRQGAATLQFSQSNITVRRGGSTNISVTAIPPKGVDARRLALWSGYVAINGSDGSSLSIPYQGLTGSLRETPVLNRGTWQGGICDVEETVMTDGKVFTVSKQELNLTAGYPQLPSILGDLNMGTALLILAIIPVDEQGQSGKPEEIERYEWVPRGFWGKCFDTRRREVWVPEGAYKLNVKALRIMGNRDNDCDFDTYSTPTFKLKYKEEVL